MVRNSRLCFCCSLLIKCSPSVPRASPPRMGFRPRRQRAGHVQSPKQGGSARVARLSISDGRGFVTLLNVNCFVQVGWCREYDLCPPSAPLHDQPQLQSHLAHPWFSPAVDRWTAPVPMGYKISALFLTRPSARLPLPEECPTAVGP
ncbi:hypothetical protein BO78DRAFT_145258 [Aspergillus sclerotiicarbonarius CBS 121057]|uniref:Uncharacterized protein n=1 Tax=Aspergillus sclerotiicarbonarius (strain CBS 121057 / IBT 28362) TaxID=1448318 RepID=A0A319E6A9_ASPSB|nr:hypothetical protein BO78DRAFT_145258 [Aspergillus sclerotiicarbonarius CBS 121057]